MPKISPGTWLLVSLATTFAYTLAIYVAATTGSPAWPRIEGALRPLVDVLAAWVPAVDRVGTRVAELGYPARAELVRHLYGVVWAIAAFWACLSLPAHLALRPSVEELKRRHEAAGGDPTAFDRNLPVWRRKPWRAQGLPTPRPRDIGAVLLAIGMSCFALAGYGGVPARVEGKVDLELLLMPQVMDSALFTPALLAPLAFFCTMAGLAFVLRRPLPPASPVATNACDGPGGDGAGLG